VGYNERMCPDSYTLNTYTYTAHESSKRLLPCKKLTTLVIVTRPRQHVLGFMVYGLGFTHVSTRWPRASCAPRKKILPQPQTHATSTHDNGTHTPSTAYLCRHILRSLVRVVSSLGLAHGLFFPLFHLLNCLPAPHAPIRLLGAGASVGARTRVSKCTCMRAHTSPS
jgi:hypothetical protein